MHNALRDFSGAVSLRAEVLPRNGFAALMAGPSGPGTRQVALPIETVPDLHLQTVGDILSRLSAGFPLPEARGALRSATAMSVNDVSQPKEMVSPFALVLLAQSPSHGYALAARLKSFGFDWGGPGPLYNHLRQLESAGLVRSTLKPGHSGPRRRTYEVTPRGRAALERYARSIDALARTLDRVLCEFREPSTSRSP